jgi:cystathionine gamma-synthase
VTPPIHLSTTYQRAEDGSYPQGFIYARGGNPNRTALEECLAALEGGESAVAFASGSAATMAVFQVLSPGDHVIAPNDVYHGTARMLKEVFAPWGLETTFLDMTQVSQVENAVRPNTRVVWVETPSNPLLKVTDIPAVSDIAHRAGAVCVCDNTWATPALQRPLELGADLVVHATTKYLGGHSDVTGGAVVARACDELFLKICRLQNTGGVVPSPFDCWLILRGIRTLPYRMRAHSENATKVVSYLSRHPSVEAVHYSGLEEHPGHPVAARQMALFGGMASFQVKGGKDGAMAVAARVRLFTRATSLIEHRASIEGPETNTPDNLLRVSIGLENAQDLIEDLAQALG